MKKNRKPEQGYPSLFNELNNLVGRARRTNLEALGNYVHGEQLREAIKGLVDNWDKFVFSSDRSRATQSIRVKVHHLDSEGGE